MSMTSTVPMPISAPARGWFRRNWKWFIPSMFLGAIFLAAVAFFGYTQIRSYGYRSNPAYQMAIAAVQESPQAQARLGDLIVDSGWFPQGRIDITGNLGDAAFNFTVTGPKGSAEVATQGRMVDGEWGITGLELRFPDDERLNLSEEIEAKQKVDTPEFDLETEKQRKSKAADKPKDDEARELSVDVPDAPPGVK